MKLNVKFERTEKVCEVRVSIEVVSAGDYPVPYIFNGTEDYPEKEKFQLKNGYSKQITRKIEAQDAQQWAENQIKALKEKLQEWRACNIPEDYYVEI